MQTFLDALGEYPVIASARDLDAVRRATQTDVAAIFLLGGSILTLKELARAARSGGKRVFVHLDLLGGLGRDNSAVEWCAKEVEPDGMISTRAPLLKRARELNILTIQRLFLMDSASLHHGVNLFKTHAPDMLEVLPGLVPKAITQLRAQINRPIIAGGMITELVDVQQAMRAGASGVSTSVESLWHKRT